MGGEEAVLEKAKNDFDNGDYRWTAMVLKQVVFANPDSVHGKNLLADTYEQLGYQAESGPWRAEYLQGAYELRNGVPDAGGTETASPDTINAMPPEMMFDYLGVRLNGPKHYVRRRGLAERGDREREPPIGRRIRRPARHLSVLVQHRHAAGRAGSDRGRNRSGFLHAREHLGVVGQALA